MRLPYKKTTLVGFLGGVVIAAITATSGAVTVYYYCGYDTAPRTACVQGSSRHSWNDNNATGKGSGGNRYLDKCERMHAWDDHSAIFSRNCGTGIQQTGRWSDTCGCGGPGIPNPGYLLEAVVGNNEPYENQIMYGAASYGT